MKRWSFPPLKDLTRHELKTFLSERTFTVIHVDASWDGYYAAVAAKLKACSDKMSDVGFGTMDMDCEQEFAQQIHLTNVRAVLYYKGSALVAQVIGVHQNVEENIEKLKKGEVIDTSNTISRF
jgi:hypothetical protein